MKQKILRAIRAISSAIGHLVINALIIAAALIALGAVFMWLWNQVMPDVFDLPDLTLRQAVLMIVLINTALVSIVATRSSDKK